MSRVPFYPSTGRGASPPGTFVRLQAKKSSPAAKAGDGSFPQIEAQRAVAVDIDEAPATRRLADLQPHELATGGGCREPTLAQRGEAPLLPESQPTAQRGQQGLEKAAGVSLGPPAATSDVVG